jgi:hypothetical protein
MKGLRLYLIGGALVLTLYFIAQYYKPRPTDWTPSYLKEDKIPFGLYILHQQLGQIFPGAEVKTSRLPVYNTLKNKGFKHTTYLLIAGAVKCDGLDYKEMVSYMQQGNFIFIAAFSMDKKLSDALKLKISSSFNYAKKKSVAINFVNPYLKANTPYVFDRGLGDQYFSKMDTSRVTVLGRNGNGDVNFIKYTFGKGGLYILPNPQLLSNYNLLNQKGAEYAARALSYLPASTQVIWDENNTRGSMDNHSILRVLFKHDQLRWAYYLAIAGLLLFVLFETKRRQRIIPVVEPLKNTSVDFVKVVGKVYYQQRDNKDIILKKISYFLEYIRTTYRLKTTHIDEELISSVILKSGVHEDVVRPLFAVITNLDHAVRVNDDQLISLNKLTEKFYKQAQ